MNDINSFACHRLYWDIDSYQGQSVVSVNKKGEVLSSKLLDEEIEHTEWIGGVIILSSMKELSLKGGFNTLLDNAFRIKKTSPLYAWHVSCFDFEKQDLGSQSILRRL